MPYLARPKQLSWNSARLKVV